MLQCLELKMKLVTDTFGNFIKFYVSLPQLNQTDQSASTESAPCRNAFDIMMAAQREKMSHVLPDKIAVRNKKDQLFNDLVTMIEKKGLQWKPSEVEGGTAVNTLKSLCDAVWYVDGHHHTFAERNLKIPESLSNFVGYNQPEKSKHRKRSTAPMRASTLKSHSQQLFGNLQLPFWDRGEWKTLKPDIRSLAICLGDYADSLSVKKQRTSALRASLSPARTVGNNLTVEYLTSRHSIKTEIAIFQEKLESAEVNTPVCIDDLLPIDRRKRYDVVQHLKGGLLSPAILATYSSGSNIGNIYWLWITDATDISSAIQSCHQAIESIKSDIPTYHTRAMRKVMFDKFGLVSKNMNKAILHHFYRDLTGDKAASTTLSEKEVDERINLLFELEEPDFIYDLRALNSSKQRFDVFC